MFYSPLVSQSWSDTGIPTALERPESRISQGQEKLNKGFNCIFQFGLGHHPGDLVNDLALFEKN